MTPQQKGVVERKNKTLEEMDRTMLVKRICLNFFGQKLLTLHAMFFSVPSLDLFLRKPLINFGNVENLILITCVLLIVNALY